MRSRHRSRLDRTFQTRAHRVLGAAAHGVDEWGELAEVVGAVGVAMITYLPRTYGSASSVGPAEPSPGVSRPCAALQSKLGGTVRRAVDDEHLATAPCSAQSFLAPSYEVGDGEFSFAAGMRTVTFGHSCRWQAAGDGSPNREPI